MKYLIFIEAAKARNTGRENNDAKKNNKIHGRQKYEQLLSLSKRNFVQSFNRENFVDSQDEFLTDNTVASNQLPIGDVGRRAEDNNQPINIPENFQDQNRKFPA